MAQDTRPQGSDGDTAARRTTPAGPGAPTTPDHDIASNRGQGPGNSRVPLIAGIVLALVVIGLFFTVWTINRPQQDQTPQPAPAPAASSATAATATTPAVAPSAVAYTAAEKTYRAWQTNYAAAFLNYQPDRLDASLVTPDVLTKAKAIIKNLSGGVQDPGTARYTQNIKSVTGADYTTSSLTLRVCAVSDLRFIDPSGTDVTLLEDRSPAPIETVARSNDVKLTSGDSGKTWQVAALTTERELRTGTPC